MSKIKIVFAVVLGVVALGGLVMQYQENSMLKQQNQILQAQAERAAADQVKYDEQRVQQNSTLQELVRLRKEHDELLKLRGEMGPLRRKLADLEKQLGVKAAAPVVAAPAPAEDPDAEAFKQQAIMRMNNVKQLVLGFRLYADDNQGILPKSVTEVLPYLGEEMKGVALNEFEIMYQGRFTDIKSPANTILLRDVQATKGPAGNWLRTYGFMDGHSEVHSEPTEDFSQWELSRLPGANMN